MDPLNDHSAAGSRLSLDEFQNNQQNLPLALIAGIIAMLVSAIAWAAVTVMTGYQIGWMAIGVGFLVGLAEVPSMMIEMASPIDLLFYAIAIFQAYKIAVRTEVVADSVEATPTA